MHLRCAKFKTIDEAEDDLVDDGLDEESLAEFSEDDESSFPKMSFQTKMTTLQLCPGIGMLLKITRSRSVASIDRGNRVISAMKRCLPRNGQRKQNKGEISHSVQILRHEQRWFQ